MADEFVLAMLNSMMNKGQSAGTSYAKNQQDIETRKQQYIADLGKAKVTAYYGAKEKGLTQTPESVVMSGGDFSVDQPKKITLLADDKTGSFWLPDETGKPVKQVDPNFYKLQNYAIETKPYSPEASGGQMNAKMLEVQSSLITRFNADASTKKSQQAIDASGDIINFANSNNPIGANAIPTYSSRMSGEVGNLSEADKRPFGGSNAIYEKINASLKQMKTGQLTENNRKFIIEFAKLVNTRAIEKMDKLARIRAKQYSALKGQPFGTEDMIYNTLRPTIEPTNANVNNIQQPTNTITAINPQTGQKIQSSDGGQTWQVTQ